jgi:hypothetical protein
MEELNKMESDIYQCAIELDYICDLILDRDSPERMTNYAIASKKHLNVILQHPISRTNNPQRRIRYLKTIHISLTNLIEKSNLSEDLKNNYRYFLAFSEASLAPYIAASRGGSRRHRARQRITRCRRNQ